MASPPLKVLALNCTLKTTRKGEASSADVLLKQLMDDGGLTIFLTQENG